MKKKIEQWLALLCNVFGMVAAVYVGGWLMFFRPLQMLYISFLNGSLTASVFVFCGVKILLSATFAGLVWCIGYIGSNYFKGDEDPDWIALNAGAEEPELMEKG